MGMTFEWADVNPGGRAEIFNDAELAEYSEDEIKPGTVGVSMNTGSNGIMLWGKPEDLAAWAEDVARRLRAGEGRSAFGELREFVFSDGLHLVCEEDGAIWEAEQLDFGYILRDNSGEGERAGQLVGKRWKVMAPGAVGISADGRVGFVVPTRELLD